jgi:transcriptional regulator with XRE-family HTH domain
MSELTGQPRKQSYGPRRMLPPLTRARLLRGHTQASLGAASGGLHPNTVSAIEHGRKPTRRTAMRIARALGVDESDLWP